MPLTQELHFDSQAPLAGLHYFDVWPKGQVAKNKRPWDVRASVAAHDQVSLL
ncbi:hypothetical protein [Pseudolysinimonas sp.]|uniref:hypothetical protein n=1 Tax=Pseudolysinimonas sp. TaxID=2680009 RepID=UPI003F7FAC29